MTIYRFGHNLLTLLTSSFVNEVKERDVVSDIVLLGALLPEIKYIELPPAPGRCCLNLYLYLLKYQFSSAKQNSLHILKLQ